jgi:CBS domain-containing protein
VRKSNALVRAGFLIYRAAGLQISKEFLIACRVLRGGAMKVRDVMIVNPSVAEMESTIEEIATIMKEEDVGAIPILDEDGELVGVVTDRDIVVRCIAEGHDASECKAEDIIKMQLNGSQVHTAYPEMDLAEAASLMSIHQLGRLPVVKDGKLVGMLSVTDVTEKKSRKSKAVHVRNRQTRQRKAS